MRSSMASCARFGNLIDGLWPNLPGYRSAYSILTAFCYGSTHPGTGSPADFGLGRGTPISRVSSLRGKLPALEQESNPMKQQLEQLLLTAVNGLVGGILPEAPEAAAVAVERTRDPKHGDFATNIALRLAKPARRSPRELAQAIIDALPSNSLVARTEVAGAGFINFFLTTEAYGRELTKILEMGDRYGRSHIGNGEKVMLEFVSANHTGPLHVGHGRQDDYGAALANLLS